MGRVSNSMMYTGMMTDTYRNLSRLLKINKQLSTGKLHHKPSDSPVDVTREMSLSTTIYENEQYVRNMEDGLTWLKNSDTAFDQIGDMTERVRELAVKAGSGALSDEEMEAIAQEMEQLQEGIMEAANYSVEGRYLLSGAATSVPPFARDSEGHVVYRGNNNKVQYEMEKGIVSDVSFTGREAFPQYYTQYSIESMEVPLDFKWSGRNEIIQLKVGDQSVKVRIPEDSWTDNDNGYVSNSPDTDYNRFRDPQELASMSLDDIAKTIENSMNMGDSGRLVSVDVVKNSATGTQKLQIRSHTGDPISITSWPETDKMPMNQAVGATVDDDPPYSLQGDGTMNISLGAGNVTTVALKKGDSLSDIAKKISSQDGLYGKVVDAGTDKAQIVIIATDPKVSFDISADGAAVNLLSADHLASKELSVPHDQSHIDLMSFLGMETSLKSREIETGSDVATNLSNSNKVHWYIDGGDKHAEVMINAGSDISLEDLATEIRAVAGDWLDVIVQTDPGDGMPSGVPDTSMGNEEGPTSKLVLRTKDGRPVNIMDLAPDSTAGNENTQLAQSMGLSTAIYSSDKGKFPTGNDLDPRMPARVRVSIGDKEYDVKLYRSDVTDGSDNIDSLKMMQQIQSQIGKGEDGEFLFQFKELAGATGQPRVAAYSHSGEALAIKDLPFGDPALSDYSAGLALKTGISNGISSSSEVDGKTVKDDWAVAAGSSGTFRIETMSRSIDISVSAGDTMKDVAEKIEKYAGQWLDVSYTDSDLDANSGVRLSISSKDGSPLNIVDLEEAQMTAPSDAPFTPPSGVATALGIATAVKSEPLMDLDLNTFGHEFTIKVDGYEHTIDLRQLDLDKDGILSASDELKNLPDLINTRFQGKDVKAELYSDASGNSKIIINSPRGYSVDITENPMFGLRGDAMNDLDLAALGTSTFDITVGGNSKTIDLSTLDLDGNNILQIPGELDGLPDLINNEFMGHPVKAAFYTDGAGKKHLQVNSLAGESVVVSDLPPDPLNPLSQAILGADNLSIDKSTQSTTKRGGSNGPMDQQVSKRTSADYKKTDFFGLMEDLIGAVRHQDRKGISSLLGDIDSGIDSLLKVRTEGGALMKRYEGSKSRLETNNINYTELYSSIGDTDLAKASMEYMSAHAVYQAGLAAISKVIQPTLVDFLK